MKRNQYVNVQVRGLWATWFLKSNPITSLKPGKNELKRKPT